MPSLRLIAKSEAVAGPISWGFVALRSLLRMLCIAAVSTILIVASSRAERLPLRRYSTTDGLPSNSINCVRRDSRNFLWFCTAEGLARFDGYTFVTYAVEQGLPDQFITDFLETRNGEYWVGTFRGLARFNPQAKTTTALFKVYHLGTAEGSQHVNSIFQDRGGVLWAATDEGVFYLDESTGDTQFHRLRPNTSIPYLGGDFIAQDDHGNLWITFGRDRDTVLYRRSPHGKEAIFHDPFLRVNRIVSLFVDSHDRIWAGTYHGLALFSAHPSGSRLFARVFTKKDGLPEDPASNVFESSDGTLWLGCGGLVQIIFQGNRVRFKRYATASQGFSGVDAEDSNGNLWMGDGRFNPHGFVTYGREDGLRTDDIRSILEGHDGQLYIVTGIHSRYIHTFDGGRFSSVVPFVPGHDSSWDWGGWGWGQTHLQDHNGEWWIATGYGLIHYPKVSKLEDLAHTPPLHIYTVRDGLAGNDIFRLYEDSRGDLWVASWGGVGLSRWDRTTNRFQNFAPHEGSWWGIATAIREDRSGNIWLGAWEHDLGRYRRGRFDFLRRADGFPDGRITSIWLDHAGRIWAGTSRGGLVRIDKPDADHLKFRAYTTKDGLSSNNVRAITEDRWGRIYFWTGRGVDRLEPNTGAVVHYTTEDGLVPAGSDNQEAFCDRDGNLWFGFVGLSELKPQLDVARPSGLRVYIRRVQADERPWPVSQLGETNVGGLTLPAGQNDIQIEFGAVNFDAQRALRYQYLLQGAGKNWSPPTDLPIVNYANIRPGAYRFLVRAIDSEGRIGAAPAVVTFQVLAPIWMRWWFIVSAIALAGLLAHGGYRLRLNRLLELERVRTRIASELHDDIGSGLTQIAILSEVARRQNPWADNEHLSRIADLSRELVDGMGELVWALNPQRDQVTDLVQRMRRFASDVLAARGIEFEFYAPAADSDVPIRSDLRRQVYLVFKEAVNNAVRHSACTRAGISISVRDRQFWLDVVDNGHGIAAPIHGFNGGGHGLGSMKQRAADMGGALEITSVNGGGTRVSLRVPLSGSVRRHQSRTT